MKLSEWYARNLSAYLTLDLLTWTGDDTDPPKPGTQIEWDYRDWDYTSGPGPAFMRVPCTLWGENCNGLVERSNYERFKEDFPNIFVDLTDGDTQSLLIPWDGEIDTALSDAILGLENYPLYDEEHHSTLRHELATEWFDNRQFGGDFVYTIQGLLHDDGDYDDTLHNDFKVTDDWLRDQFWTYVRTLENDDWIVEDDGYNVYVSIITIEEAAESVVDTLIADWNAKVTWLKDRQEGLF